MQRLFFWSEWDKEHRRICQVLIVLLISLLMLYIISYYKGAGFVINWGTISVKEGLKIHLDTFSRGLFSFSTFGENFIITQQFIGNDLQINHWPTYLYLVCLAIGIIMGLSVITTLKRFYYVIGMVVFVALITNFKVEHLQLWGRIDKVPLIIIYLLYLPASYYFHAIRPETSFKYRLLGFSLITVLVSLLIYFFAEVNHPFLYLANYGILGPLLITLAFILMISHEIIYGCIYLITFSNAPGTTHTLRHFALLSGFYVANLIMLYLNETKIISWNIIFLDPYWLLLLSVIVGIYGLRKRIEVIDNIIRFKPYGALMYMAVAVISLATINYFFHTANDPIAEVVKDTIIYGHLGFSVIFLVYIIANFISPLKNNMQVFKVIYKPQNMPYFTYRLAGLIAVTAMILKENIQVPIYHSLSGYYNGIGDIYNVNDDFLLAEQYYKYGSEYGYQNHRSNYALASIANRRGRKSQAANYFRNSLEKRPTEYAFVNLSNILLEEDRYFDALFNLQNASGLFPKSGPVHNNMGLVLGKTNLVDTSLILLNYAMTLPMSEQIAKANLVGIAARKNFIISSDSVRKYYQDNRYIPSVTNALAMHNINKQLFEADLGMVNDTSLNIWTSALVINQMYNKVYDTDTVAINYLKMLREHPGNGSYRDAIGYLLAVHYYYHQQLMPAFRILEEIAYKSIESGFFFNTLGLWALQNNAFQLADRYFIEAGNKYHPQAKLNRAITQLEWGHFDRAKMMWEELLNEDRYRETAEKILKVLNYSAGDSISELSDLDLYQLIRYRTDLYQSEIIDEIFSSIDSKEAYLKAMIDMIHYFLRNDDRRIVIQLLNNLEVSPQSSSEYDFEFEKARMEILSRQGEVVAVKAAMDNYRNSNYWNESNLIQKRHYEAQIALHEGDTSRAEYLFGLLGEGNPFYEHSLISAANYFSFQKKAHDRAYNILVEALSVNNTSIPLLKAYTLQSVRSRYTNYASQGLDMLKERLSDQEYVNFKREYDRLTEEFKDEGWDN